MESVLLEFNISAQKSETLKKICKKLKIKEMKVSQADFTQPLGALLGASERKNEVCLAPFGGEMIVMAGMSGEKLDEFLASLRSESLSIPLKAMLTAVNINWRCVDLYNELESEHKEMMKRVRK